MPVDTLTKPTRRRGYTNPDDSLDAALPSSHTTSKHSKSKQPRVSSTSSSPSTFSFPSLPTLKDTSTPLYNDSFLTIYPTSIVLKKYYFPFVASKRLLLPEVVRLDSSARLALDPLEYNIWGLSDVSNSIWWALDVKREMGLREGANGRGGGYCGLVISVKNDGIRKGVSVQWPERAFPVLRFLFEGRAICNF
jgi:hypothetical protein